MPMKNNQEFITESYIVDIENFASLVPLFDAEIITTIFNTKSVKEEWQLLVYPNGDSDEDYIAFYLSKTNISEQFAYDFTLSIGRPDKSPDISYSYKDVQFVGRDIGEEFFLHKKSHSRIIKGPIRFRCDITKIELKNGDLTHSPSLLSFVLADTENLSLDLKELLDMPFLSDLTIKIGGKEMYVHKYMLYAWCTNLISEFGYLEIKDMPSSVETQINHEIFQLLMHYIYTGKLRDSYVPLELFRLAQRLGLSSLRRCVHEKSCINRDYSEINTEEKVIIWNLKELEFLEESLTCVHILQTTLCVRHLAVQLNISDGCGDEKFIDVSFKFLGVAEDNPIILISKLSITSEDGLHAFKEEQHIFFHDEQWNISFILCQKDKYCYKRLMCLTAELGMYDWSNFRSKKGLDTKTLLFTNHQCVSDNLEDLRSCMDFLLETAQSTGNLDLLSEDNQLFRVHDGIMWARWPGLKKLIEDLNLSKKVTGFVNQLELKLPSKVLRILLPYLYTGFIENFNPAKAELLLKYRSEVEYPFHLVKKCEAILSV